MSRNRIFAMFKNPFRSRAFIILCLLLFLSFLLILLRIQSGLESESAHIDQILKAIEPITQNVVLPHNQTVILEPWDSNSCQNSGQYILLMFITSPENEGKRQVIRKAFKKNVASWEEAVLNQSPQVESGATSIKALFFVGQPSQSTGGTDLLTKIMQEGNLHGDMVIDDFQESYLNLTVKTLRMLKWVERNCAHVTYLVKIDDDVFLNVPLLLKFLTNYNTTAGQDLIAGHKYNHIEIDSDPNSKWYTPKFLWRRTLPNFASGVCYVLGSRVRSDLYLNALKANLFHLEDVFLTGMVRERFLSNRDIVNIDIRVWWNYIERFNYPCYVDQNVVAIHPLSTDELQCYYTISSLCAKRAFIPLVLLC